MAHKHTVFAQLLKVVSRHDFESLARKHHTGRKLRQMTRWSQFVALGLAQLSGRRSLRDIVSNLRVQSHRLYHLGCRQVSRSSLARVNNQQPYKLYEELFGKLLARCRSLAPKHRFRFRNKLISLDASIIELSLSVFPWATFNRKKGAVKLHLGLDHDGYLPSFVSITEGDHHEMKWARTLDLPKGSVVVFDKGFIDYAWFNDLNNKGISFVTRMKKRARYKVVKRNPVPNAGGITSDEVIILTDPRQRCTIPLRRVGYYDQETGKLYVYLTNAFHLAARTIADIYKERWQIELFFKWIKQNLKIKSFLGTSMNAVLTQIWVAMCIYLLLAYLKYSSKLKGTMLHLLRLLQLNLFEKRNLIALLRGGPPSSRRSIAQRELRFA
jgi:putative transposase